MKHPNYHRQIITHAMLGAAGLALVMYGIWFALTGGAA